MPGLCACSHTEMLAKHKTHVAPLAEETTHSLSKRRLSSTLLDMVKRQSGWGGGARGGTPSNSLGRQTERQKKIKIKIRHGLKRPPYDEYTTTNQKKAAATEGTMEGRCDEQDMRGKRDTIVLGAL